MEQGSDHYIAHTISAYGTVRKIPPLDLENLTYHSNGISCRYQNETYCFGSMDFVNKPARPERGRHPAAMDIETSPITTLRRELHVKNHQPEPSFISFSKQGAQVISTVFLSVDDRIAAAVHLGDAMKTGVKTLVADLYNMGLTCFLISGDAERPTLAAGAFVQIPAENTHGGLLPHEKAEFIKQLKQSGKKVAMVGDGVNDAPAMAQSDIAMAVHSGLNPGEGVAAITLMQETPVQIIDFIALATRVNRKVKQNLIFALVYNIISIPVAAAGFLNPIIAATAMLLSSLSVTCNTLLLVKSESSDKPRSQP
jgi:cation transport ATPase